VTSIFVYHLISDILNLSPVLKNIAKAVWRPRVHLVLTLILFLFGMYVFAAIGFVYFREYYKQGLKRYCDSIFECFLVTLDKGFKFDGGVGNWLNLRNEGSDDMKSKYQGVRSVAVFVRELVASAAADHQSEHRERCDHRHLQVAQRRVQRVHRRPRLTSASFAGSARKSLTRSRPKTMGLSSTSKTSTISGTTCFT
jgi:hypothetical protein